MASYILDDIADAPAAPQRPAGRTTGRSFALSDVMDLDPGSMRTQAAPSAQADAYVEDGMPAIMPPVPAGQQRHEAPRHDPDPQFPEPTTAGAMGRQFARGAIETAALAPKGAAALGARLEFNEQDIAGITDRYAAADPAARAQMRRDALAQFRGSPGTRDSLMSRFSDIDEGVAAPRPQPVTPIEQRRTYQVGEAIDEFGRQTFPTTREEDAAFWTGQVPRALGSTAAMAPVALAGAPFGAAGRLLASVGLATTGSGEAVQNAMDRRRTLEDMVRAGDAPSPDAYPTDRQIATAAGQGLAPGALDAASIDNLLRPVLRGPGWRGVVSAIAKKAIEQGVVEGTTEGVQQVMQNLIARFGYEPSQAVIDQVAENVLVGGIVGVLTGGAGGAMARRAPPARPQEPLQGSQPVPQQGEAPGVSRETLPVGATEAPPVATPGGAPPTAAPTPPIAGVTSPIDSGQGQPPVSSVSPAAAGPAPGTPADFEAVMNDPRPLAEIAAERQRRDTIAAVAAEDGPDAAAAVGKVLDGQGTRTAPVQVETAQDIDMAAARAAEPTPAQAEAGNYRMGHVRIHGLDITIETPRGGTRTGLDAEGRPWSNPDYPAHYGYLKAGRDTGDGKVDVFVGDEPASRLVYVIDQIDPKTGKFDEPKVMIGFEGRALAAEVYQTAFPDGSGEARMGAITPMTVAEFQAWLKGGDPTKPLAYVQPPPVRSIALSDIAPAPPAPATTVPPPGGQAAAPGLVSGTPVPTPAPVATPDQVANRLAASIGVSLTPAERLDMVELMVGGTDPELALEIALTRSGVDVALEVADAIEEVPYGDDRPAGSEEARGTGGVAADEGPPAERDEPKPAPAGETGRAQPVGDQPAEGKEAATAVAVRTETTPAAPLTLRVGSRTYPVESVEDASRIFVAARDKFGEGASNTPTPLLVRDGKVIGYVSYNGRVWAGDPKAWKPDDEPIYDPLPPPEKPSDAAAAALPAPKVDAPRQRALSAKEKRAEAERKKRDAAITRREAAKKAIQTRKANAGALNIVQTIAAAGGIKDTSGDLRTIMGRPNLMVPVYGALRNDKGMEPDRAREMLVEAGFLPEGATLNDLYAAIDQTVRGKPVMSARDVNAQLDRAEERKAAKYGAEPTPEDDDGALKDAGEKIGGSRADRWRERGLTLADLDGMSGADASAAVTKQNIWRPDYAKMIEDGATPLAAALVKVQFDDIAAKPERDTPEGRSQFVRMMEIVRDEAAGVKTPEQAKMLGAKIRERIGWYSDGIPSQQVRSDYHSLFRGRSDPLHIGYNEMQKAGRMVDAGFPAAVEPWTRRFSLRNYDGKWIVYGAGERKFRRLHEAATKDEGEAWARAEYERTKSAKAEGVEPERPHLDKIERRGADVRGGRNITSQEFIDEFGFRGVEFGNWAASDERQKAVNLAYEALHDLASVLKIPPKAVSLNGSLGLAFGARGGGRFAAHYEPGKLAINLTKLRGGGSLAHEWGHAVDHYLGELDRTDAYKASARGVSGWYGAPKKATNLRPELAAAFDDLMQAIFRRNKGKAERVRESELGIEKTIAEIARQEDRVAASKAALAKDPERDKNTREKFIRDSEAWIAQRRRVLEIQRKKLAELTATPDADLPKSTTNSSFLDNAIKLSGKQGSSGYWARPTEMFARSFEAFVFDKIGDAGNVSQYLVQGVEPDRYADQKYRGNPYPTNEERATINAAWDKVVAELRTREGVRGPGLALYQRPSIERIAVAKDSISDEQMVIPGAERVASEGRKAAKAPQRSVAETPLFGGEQDATRDVKRADAERETKRQGTLFQKAQIDTPEFRRWFGDSKVVDENGDPLVVYHGTKSAFSVFHPSRGGEFGSGIYFSAFEPTARMFGGMQPGDGEARVVAAYVSMRNPLITADRNIPRGAGMKKLMRQGYDGVIGIQPNGERQYVVFSPNQVKSATENSGAFDPSDPDIRAQAGDRARLRVAGAIDATVNLSPQDQARRDATLRALNVTLRRMAGKAAPSASVFDRMMVGDQEILGVYSPADHLLALSMRSPDPIGTVRHETIHVMRQLGLIDDAAWSALSQAAERDGWLAKHAIDERWGDGLTREQAIEEAIAEEFGVGLREGVWKTGNAKVDAIFQRIAEFLRRVRAEVKRALAAGGMRGMSDADVAELVFSLIERGAFREGEITARVQQDAMAQVGDEDAPLYQMAQTGAQQAAARPESQRRSFLGTAIAALKGGNLNDPRAKVQEPHDIGLARKLLITPRTIGAYFPEFARVFRAGVRQFRARDMMISDLTEMARGYMELPQGSKEKINKVLEHGRMAGETYAPDADGTITVKNKVGQQIKGKIGGVTLMKDGEEVKLTPDEARAYRAYRATMDTALDRFRDQVLREWGYDPADAATPRDAQAVEEIAKDTENAGERARLKTLADVLLSIQRAKKTGYVPFTRYGSHYVTVTSLQDGKQVVVHREHIEPGITTSPRTKLTRARLEQEGARVRKRLAEIYPPDRGFEISELREVTPDSLDDLPSFSDLDAIIGAANLPPEQAAKVMEAVGELIKKRGFRAHFIKSRNIPGYSTDLERSLADYIVGISGYLARREHMPEIEQAIAGIPPREPKLREYAKAWNDYIQNPSEELQSLRQAGFLMYLGGRISSAAVNLSQIPIVTMPWLSMFSNPVAANAQIARAYKDVGMAIRPLPKSRGGAGLEVFDVEKLPEDVRPVVRAALKDGRLLPIETFDIMATARGRTPGARTIAAKAQYVKDGLAYAFQAAERTNRLVTFIAAYRLAQNPVVMNKINETLRKDGQWTEFRKERQRTPEDFATFSVEETQFMQGKINRSGVMRGPGTAIFQFKSFMLNYLEILARMGFFGAGSYRGGARFAAMAGLMGMLVLTSGLMGLPGAEDGIEILDALVKYFTGVDPQFERRIREAGGSVAAAVVAALGAGEETQETARGAGGRMLARGPLRETGVDVSQRVGQGRVAPQPTGGQFDPFWERAAGLLGIPASLALRIPATLTNLWNGDWLSAGISASPEFIADAFRARQFATEGVKTRARGQLVMPPEEVLPDDTTVGGASNVTKRALGFQPTGISRAREQMWAVQRAGSAANAIRAEFNLARAKAAAAIAKAEARGDVQAQRLAEARLEALVEKIATYNASASPADRYDFNSPGYQQQYRREMQGQRSGIDRKMPKRGREELPSIRSAY